MSAEPIGELAAVVLRLQARVDELRSRLADACADLDFVLMGPIEDTVTVVAALEHARAAVGGTEA